MKISSATTTTTIFSAVNHNPSLTFHSVLQEKDISKFSQTIASFTLRMQSPPAADMAFSKGHDDDMNQMNETEYRSSFEYEKKFKISL